MLCLRSLRSMPVGVSLVALTCLFIVPSVARGQQAASGIAGIVRDSSGAVLPGVTVEAASPLVDIQNTRQQVIVSKDQLDSLPVYRGLSGIEAFDPAVASTVDVGGTKGIHNSLIVGTVHGKTQSQKNYFDGMRISCTVG